MIKPSNDFKIFKINLDTEKFIMVEKGDKPLEEFLESSKIYLILDSINKKAWIWNGSEAGVRIKFIAAQKAPDIRNNYAVDYKIAAVDEYKETEEFKDFLNRIN